MRRQSRGGNRLVEPQRLERNKKDLEAAGIEPGNGTFSNLVMLRDFGRIGFENQELPPPSDFPPVLWSPPESPQAWRYIGGGRDSSRRPAASSRIPDLTGQSPGGCSRGIMRTGSSLSGRSEDDTRYTRTHHEVAVRLPLSPSSPNDVRQKLASLTGVSQNDLGNRG